MRQRQEPWRATCSTCQPPRRQVVRQRLVGEDRHVGEVVEVPPRVAAGSSAAAGSAARPGAAPACASASSRSTSCALEVLEQVRGEHDVEAGVVELRRGRCSRRRPAARARRGRQDDAIEVHGGHRPRLDVVREVAPAGAQLEHVGVSADPALQVGADVPPHRRPVARSRRAGSRSTPHDTCWTTVRGPMPFPFTTRATCLQSAPMSVMVPPPTRVESRTDGVTTSTRRAAVTPSVTCLRRRSG